MASVLDGIAFESVFLASLGAASQGTVVVIGTVVAESRVVV